MYKRTRKRIAGERFGDLIALDINRVQGANTYWNTVCDCGEKRIVPAFRLNNGEITSCKGCSRFRLFGRRETRPMELYWEFSATNEKTKRIWELLKSGARTVNEIHSVIKGSLDSTMDCLSVLVDQGRLNIGYKSEEERLYSLKKTKTHSPHNHAEVGFH